MARPQLRIVQDDPGDIDALIAARVGTPLLAFEPILSSPSHRIPKFKQAINGILKTGYPMRGAAHMFPLDKPQPWDHADRTLAYFLHAFSPLSPVLVEHSISSNSACFEAALKYLDDWLKIAHAPMENESDFMWYDMAVALRCYKIAYIADVLMRSENPDRIKIARLMEVLYWHRDHLMHGTLSSHNNHGLYQALGQIAMSRRFRDIPAYDVCYAQGQDRLDNMLKNQFFADGVHREHSPGYHWMLLGTLTESMQVGLIEREDHLRMIGKIEESMSWFIQPNGQMPAFGDTDTGGIEVGYYKPQDFTHPALRDALTDHVQPGGLRLFTDSGYAVLKETNPKTSKIETYLAQAAGFHSQTHKHADHLTFTWHDKGEDLLVDSGHYAYRGRTEKNSELWNNGFWYADPKRIYVEKTLAHNTVSVDGLDFPRRGVKPFGSALGRTARDGNKVHAIETSCRPFKNIRYDRVLFISPRRFLIVFDWLKDNTDQVHDFRQWFHLGPKLDVTPCGYDLTLTRGGRAFGTVMSLKADVTLEQIVRGQSDPDINGWVSHDKGSLLMPNWAFALKSAGRAQTSFATLFSLYPNAKGWKTAQIAPSGQAGKLFWQDRSGFNTLEFTRLPGQDMTVRYHRTEKDI